MDMKRLVTDCTAEILKRLGSYAFDQIGLVWGAQEGLKKLRTTLETIKSVVDDAEDQQMQGKMVRLCLKRFTSVADDIVDILDEVVYDTRKREIEGDAVTDQNILEKAVSFVSSSVDSAASTCTVAQRVKNINEMLDDIVKEMKALNLRGGGQRSAASDRHHHPSGLDRDTSPFVDHSKVFGREDEKIFIRDMLVRDSKDIEENFSVIPIVGFGGLGKTTLAQLVCADEEVTKHFDPIDWVCVANDSGHGTVMTKVFQGIFDDQSVSIQIPRKAQIQKRLMERLRGKRFLMVLDDVWNTEQWEDISVVLEHGAKGSAVIVTTRKDKVAETMSTVLSPYRLKPLLEKYCWEIFEQRAFAKGGPPETPAFEEIGREIVKKCGGFPLAVESIGALLHSKKTFNEWVSIKDREDLLVTDEAGLMAWLRLNYDHLASPLKKCFKYCAVFSKGSTIMKDDLVRQWIALGFIPLSSDDHIEMEEVGNDYFQHLRWNSLFQHVEKDPINGVISCKMHDIVCKLALSVAENECFVVDSSTDVTKNRDIGETRHFRTNLDDKKVNSSILENLSKSKAKLRSFASSIATWASYGWLEFKLLRVLWLERVGNLPSSIGEVKLLRYLYLGSMEMQKLPQSICQLYLLETLDVRLCFVLIELPEDIWKLNGLRHILLPSQLRKMPKMFGGLRRLQTISPSLYLGQEEDGRGVTELEHLNHITGHLVIGNMENLRSATHAKKAKLNMKKMIFHLTMKWTENGDEGMEESNDRVEAAVALELPPNLQDLSMKGFPGVKLPAATWSLGYLIHIELEKCNMLEEFPPACHTPSTTLNMLQTIYVRDCPMLKLALASFTSLKEIFVSKIHSVVVEVAVEEAGSSSTANFQHCYLPSLISLDIEYVPEFIALPKGFLQRSENLQLVSIKHCDRFRGFHGEEDQLLVPRTSILKTVKLMSCSSADFVDVRGLTSLEKLEIISCRNAGVTAARLPSLKYLRLHSVQSFVMEPEANNLDESFLTGLNISEVEDFTTFPKGLIESCSKYLRWLDIEGCPKFQGFSQDELNFLVSLERLCIIKCPSITSLGVRGLVCLRELAIVDCKGIKSSPFPKGPLESLTLLHTLEIGGFSEELDYLPFPAIQGNNNPLCSSLKKLTIWGWSNVNSLPHHVQHLAALETLQIKCFDALIALPEWLGNLSSLDELKISDCRAIMDFPSAQQMQRLTSLISVRIENCPLLSHKLMSDDQEWLKICSYDHDDVTSTTTISFNFGIPNSLIRELEESLDLKQLVLNTSLSKFVGGPNGSQ